MKLGHSGPHAPRDTPGPIDQMKVLASPIKTEQSRQQDQMQCGPHRSRDSPGPSIKRQSRPISRKGPRPHPSRVILGHSNKGTLQVLSVKGHPRSHPSMDTPRPIHQVSIQVPPISGHSSSHPSSLNPGPTHQ